MKRLFTSFLLLLACCGALGQTFPVQNLQVNGTSLFTGVATFTVPVGVGSGGTGTGTAGGAALDNISGFAGTGFMSRTGAGTYSFTASTGSGSVVLGTSPTITTPTISSPAITGTPTAPTAATSTNTTQLATTAFVAGSLPCTTSAELGMDATGATDNTAALNTWVTSYSGVANFACLAFGPGTFKFSSTPTIPLPNALWSAASSTSNTMGTGSKTFTVATGLTIPAGGSAYAYHATSSAGANQLLTGTVTSYNSGTGALVLNITSCSPSCTGTAYTSWGIVQSYLGGASFGTITFKGQGIDTTTLLINGAVGGPLFKFAGLIQSALIGDMTIATNVTGGQSGPCLSMTNSFPFLGAEQSITTVRNVACRGADAWGGVDYWATNFSNQGVSNVNYLGVIAFGDNTGGTHGTGMVFTNPGTYGCVALNSPWSCGENYNIRDSYFDGLLLGISYGVNTQFVGVYNSQFLNGPSGISVPASGGILQGLTVTGNTFFTTATAIADATGVKNIFIADNFFAMNAGAYSINLNPTWAVSIVGNQFTPFTSGTSLGAMTFPGASNDISEIFGNVISAGGNTVTNGIVLGAATTNNFMVFGNQFSGVTNTIINNGTANVVGVTGGPRATTTSNQVVNGITTAQ